MLVAPHFGAFNRLRQHQPETIVSNIDTPGAPASFLTIASGAHTFRAAGFTEASLRWLAFNRKHNGFNRAFVKVGRRLLIDEAEFIAAIRNQARRPRGRHEREE